MNLYLVHHGDAVGAEVDPQRPLSRGGRETVERLASAAAARGVRAAVFWHSGKIRAEQTADAFRRVCNPLAPCAATRDVQPDDPPSRLHDRLRGETRDILIAGHFPHLPRLLALLLTGAEEAAISFPSHGIVALETTDEGSTWVERWRLDPSNA